MKFKVLILCLVFIFFSELKGQKKENFKKDFMNVIKQNDPKKIIAGMNTLVKTYKLDTLKYTNGVDVMKGSAAIAFLKKDDLKNFELYLNKIKDKFNQTSYMNIAAEILYESNKNLNYAHNLAEKTIRLYESYKDDPQARPEGFNRKDWERFMKLAAYPYNETFAKVLHAQGKSGPALYYLEKALQNKNFENMMPETAQLYSSLLIAGHYNEKAYKFLRRETEFGRATKVMEAQFKTLYSLLTKKDADAAMDSIQKNMSRRYAEEVSKKIITGKKASDFNLKTLDGNSVSLKSLRGKIVVLDFWATWCAPCIKSLPSMSKINKKNPDVVFLYIVTKETGSDAVQRIKKFVKEHQITLNILIDIPDKRNYGKFITISDYNITRIPAKVVIDKMGAIRFFSVGFTNENELNNELQAMIDIVKMQ